MKNWCTIKDSIESIAIAEELLWTRSNGTKKRESEPDMLPVLERYWGAVPGINAHDLAQSSANGTEAWSAAFICYLFRTAGIDATDGFIFGRRHLNYIVGALRNRESGDKTKPFWLCDSIEIINEAVPERGDLICYNRGGSNWSYSTLSDLYKDNHDVPLGVSHCNVVISVELINGIEVIKTVGGNINHSVRHVYLSNQGGSLMHVDANGDNPTAAHDIFGIVKNLECA